MAASMITCFAMATHRRPAPRRPRESSSPPCYLSTFEPEPPPTAAPPTLRARARERPPTLLSAARDLERSHVAVLRRVLASPQAPCSGGTRTQAIPAAAAAASPSGLSSKTRHSPGGTRKRRAASRKGSG